VAYIQIHGRRETRLWARLPRKTLLGNYNNVATGKAAASLCQSSHTRKVVRPGEPAGALRRGRGLLSGR